MYIAITSKADTHLRLVEPHLDEPLHVIDHTQLLAGVEMSHHINHAGKVTTRIDGRELKAVKSVWYRRLSYVAEGDLPVPAHMVKYCMRAMDRFTDLIHQRFPAALWVSPFAALLRAEDKLYQLEVAHRVGLRIPETLFTSSPAEARRFVERHKQAIAKPLSIASFDRGGKSYGFYSSKIGANASFGGLHVAPTIFQQSIELGVDVRVIAVGKQAFAATIQSDMPGGKRAHVRDWRADDIDDHHKIAAHDLPAKTARQCVALIKELGLNYGAIDLILDKHGKYWFLENNPCGQWGFVELPTGQPIGKALASLLMASRA